MNTTKTNEQILAEFNAFFAQANKEVSTIVDKAINLEAIEVIDEYLNGWNLTAT